MRKRIGLITICPEADYQRRFMDGIFAQCSKYDYDVVVITSLVGIANYYQDYRDGELNIYNLINFDLLDGVVITPIPMTEDRIDSLVANLLKRCETECKVPVVSAGLEFGSYPVVMTDDKTGFMSITEHLITEHGCKDIAVLTGMKDYPLSEIRVEGVREAMAEHNLTLDDNKIFYGDFWYSGGRELATRILSSEVERPEAVICGSDAMAVGLIEVLKAGDIKVPEDIIVTGYDARAIAALNNPSITSYAPDDLRTGAECINVLRRAIEPGAPVYAAENAGVRNMRMGASCGCREDVGYENRRLRESLYLRSDDFENHDPEQSIDVGELMESYTAEILTSTDTPEHCIQKIYESKYLLQPYGHFYICLSEDWLDIDSERTEGYPDHMQMVLKADRINNLHGYDYHVFFGEKARFFDTVDMLPQLKEENDRPQVFYFVPLHFQKKVLGYAVLQNDLDQKAKIGLMFRTYIRNINNALEMSRAKNRIASLSEHDMMTGLLNRRGMEVGLKQLQESAPEDAKYLVYVIDMDGLKYMNDNYGHTVGDTGIKVIADAVRHIAVGSELCVRGGGDEFYVVGIGDYTEDAAKAKRSEFLKYLKRYNADSELPVKISASIGYALKNMSEAESFQSVLDTADVAMYLDKRSKKNRR